MKVQVLYFDGCPNHGGAVDVVRAAARELGVAIELETVPVEPGGDLAELRFLGSPTVLVDGVDVEPSARARTDFAFGCRVYGPAGGVPPRDLVLAALARSAP
jgi:hypothetical protein